jgi:protein-disulfide isomerase
MVDPRLVVASLAFAFALLPVAGCTGDSPTTAPPAAPAAPAPAPAAAPPAAGSGDTVATIGSRTITRGELESAVRSQLISIENERYEALRNGLDGLIAVELMAQEATAQGTTPDALIQTEVIAKAGAPSDAEIEQLFQQAQAQLGGRPLDEVRPQLVGYLEQQRQGQRHAAYVEELKAKHPTQIALKPPVVDVDSAGRPGKGGGEDAPIQIVMFSDYECPFCGRAETVVDQVMETYGDKVRLYFRDYPLPFHANATPAAEAANCAAAQDKFWEYHAKLFANQRALGAEDLKRYAGEIGLDQAKFDTCVDERTFQAAVAKDLKDGADVGVDGTPAFFINGRMLSGAQPFEKFKEIIDEELAGS